MTGMALGGKVRRRGRSDRVAFRAADRLRSLVRLSLAVALVGLAIGRASAEPPPDRPAVTVEAVLPGCRLLVASAGVPTSAEAGFCSGLFDGLLYLGEMIPADFCFAVPSRIPRHRVVAAVVEEIEPVYPSVKQQHFRGLAIEVLAYKWPCHIEPKVLTREQASRHR